MEPDIRAVAFDLDGTMVNSEEIYDRVLGELLGRRGYKLDLELKRSMMGLKAQDAFAVLTSRFEFQETPEQLKTEVTELFGRFMPEMLKTMPGLESCFAQLDDRQLPRAVTTSSPKPLANLTLIMANIAAGFEFVLTGDDVENGKPHPEVYLKAAEKFGIEPAQMLVFEDSVTGSRSAAAAGALTIAIPGEHSEGMDFSHCWLVLESLEKFEFSELPVAK